MSAVMAAENEYAQFKRTVGPLLPVCLDYYKQQQMERRIRDLARKHQAADLRVFGEMLHKDAALLRELEQHITINVSEFFRNPTAFEYLSSGVFPRLLAGGKGVRVWSAGCSYGAEPYTLAMLLHTAAPGLRHSIYATDIDRQMLDKARVGKGFTREDVQNLPTRLRERYVRQDGASYAVAPELLPLIRFDRRDLLRDRITGPFDLIACRNVVIYFTDEAKTKLYQSFVDALRPGGYLFIGATEVIGSAAQLGLRYIAPCFYIKDER